MLFACALAMVPTLTPMAFGVIIGVGGLAGLAIASRAGLWIGRATNLERTDRLWYAAVPMVSYVLIVVAAVLMVEGVASGLGALALALGLLIAAGIRNAWDMIIFIIGQGENTP